MTKYSDFGSGEYEPSSIQAKTTGAYEDRITFTGYNINGGLLSQSKKYGASISYPWSYNNLFPVAEAKNAASNQIYYEGFEYSTTATAGAAHTGKRYNNVAFTVSLRHLPAATLSAGSN